MRRLCSWCGETLESGSPLPRETTHGVCAGCARGLLASIAGSSGADLTRRAAEKREGAGAERCEVIAGFPKAHVIRRPVCGAESRGHAKP